MKARAAARSSASCRAGAGIMRPDAHLYEATFEKASVVRRVWAVGSCRRVRLVQRKMIAFVSPRFSRAKKL